MKEFLNKIKEVVLIAFMLIVFLAFLLIIRFFYTTNIFRPISDFINKLLGV
jgi:hypothetical protein